MLADGEFESDSERFYTYIRQWLRARSVTPARRWNKSWSVQGIRLEMRRAFPCLLYRRGALIESGFLSVDARLSACTPNRLLLKRQQEFPLLGLSLNFHRQSIANFF